MSFSLIGTRKDAGAQPIIPRASTIHQPEHSLMIISVMGFLSSRAGVMKEKLLSQSLLNQFLKCPFILVEKCYSLIHTFLVHQNSPQRPKRTFIQTLPPPQMVYFVFCVVTHPIQEEIFFSLTNVCQNT